MDSSRADLVDGVTNLGVTLPKDSVAARNYGQAFPSTTSIKK
jgi:hypothetical protein